MPLLACGSNTASHLALGHASDVHRLSPCSFHPSLSSIFRGAELVDLVSASAHTLLLLRLKDGTHLLLGAGTNTLGQLGPKCALWDEVKPQTRFKGVDLRPLELLQSAQGEWEPVKVAAAWTSSYVVFRRVQSASGAAGPPDSDMSPEERSEVLVACGSNDFNELGHPVAPDGTHVAVTRPSDNPAVVDMGLRPGEWIEHLKAGQRHVVVVVASGQGQSRTQRVMGWGASRKGELDPSTAFNGSGSGSGGRAALSSKGKGKTKAASHPACLPRTVLELPVPHGAHIIDLALGSAHSVALLSTGQVIAWGSDQKGQITSLGSVGGVQGIGATWGGTYLLSQAGDGEREIWSQGWNTLSHRSTSTTERSRISLPDGWEPVRIVTGSEHLLVLARERSGEERLFVGGWNEHGNLGLDDTQDRADLVLSLEPRPVQGMWGGCASTWVWSGEVNEE